MLSDDKLNNRHLADESNCFIKVKVDLIPYGCRADLSVWFMKRFAQLM